MLQQQGTAEQPWRKQTQQSDQALRMVQAEAEVQLVHAWQLAVLVQTSALTTAAADWCWRDQV